MGTGSLRRIAALTVLATISVLAGGAVSVPAQLTVPDTTVTTPTLTVPSTTVRVPSTTTTVTTPTLTTPDSTVEAPAPKTSTTAVTEPVDDVKKTVSSAPSTGATTGGDSGGGDTVGVGGTLSGVTGNLEKTSTAAAGDGGRTIGASGSGPGGGGGTTGGPGGGGIFGSGFGGGSSAAGVGSLATMLAGASSWQLRSVLEQLEGCLLALPAADRRVLSLRAGLDGAPLSRTQVGQRVGLSPRGVRSTERRALNRLQFAATNTGCAASVVGPFDPAGIGNLAPQLVLAGAVPVNAGSAAGDFAQTRGIVGRAASPLFQLGGGGQGGPAWAIVLFTVLLSVSLAALTREVRHSV